MASAAGGRLTSSRKVHSFGTRAPEKVALRESTTSKMAKRYRFNFGARLINSVFRWMTKLGLGASYRYILTVLGRKTGRLYSTPVDVIEVAGDRWRLQATDR
jgi:hypothetical protein